MNLRKNVLGIPDSKSIRQLLREKGWLAIVISIVAVLLALFHIYTSYAGALEALRHRSIHLAAILIIVFLVSSQKRKGKSYLVLNIALSVLAAIVGGYVFIESVDIPLRLGNPNQWDLVLGTIIILLTLEAARRVVGLAISVIAAFLLFYDHFGLLFPGFLQHAPYSFREIINTQFLDLVGLWGIPLGTMSTFIIIFLIFAGLFFKSGAIDVFMDLANKIFGRTAGGPAKVAIVGSTFIGSISGSAAANTLITGSVSIPTMKRLGYKPEFAGAVEASCSSGGQFMPPIMGASAFIIAAFLGIPYITVCKNALFPALLWFFSFFMILHFVAKRLKLATLSKGEVREIEWSSILKRVYLFTPLVVLIILLVLGYTPMLAGFWSIVALIGLSFFRRETRLTVATFLGGLEDGIRSALPVTMACAAAGLVVGTVMQSGLGYTLSSSLVNLSGGNIAVLLPLVLVASIILGMGMTTVGAYIIVAVLVAPAMIKLGVVPIAGHFFCFYFAIVSAITPPVAVAAYAAAGLTGTSPWTTAVTAIKLAIPALCIPFVFVFQPGLLLIGDVSSILATLATTTLGVVCLCSVVAGHFLRELNIFERIILALITMMFFVPYWWLNLIALGLLGASLLVQRKFTLTQEA